MKLYTIVINKSKAGKLLRDAGVLPSSNTKHLSKKFIQDKLNCNMDDFFKLK